MSANVGIPTKYKGIQFRSRAEARWAVLMDRLGWVWEYEPIDLDGYIPDFLVHTKRGQMVVEVKGGVLGIHPLLGHTDKTERSGWTGPALIVGAVPCSIGGSYYVLGKHARPENIAGGTEWDWMDAEAFYCFACDRVSFLHANETPICQLCDAEARMPATQRAANLIAFAWAEAGNQVQWRAAAE